jgi:2-polyprenyl-3-methyl-5-hydroxy-6-metoxy-1,4-benzoquinol methylase
MTVNVHPHEIEKFGALASRWWDPTVHSALCMN